MILYILTRVNGYAQLEELKPFTDELKAQIEMRCQYNKQRKEKEYDYEDCDNIHAELSGAGDQEYEYSWDITTIDTDKL